MRHASLLPAALAVSLLSAAAPARAAPPQPAPASSAAPDAAQAYMARIATAPGVVTTASGLAYKVEASGPAGGAHPQLGDAVQVTYTGRLTDGAVFDSSDNAGGPVALTVGRLVPGWNEALQLMRPGDDWTLYVPPSLGYGDEATGPIPPNSVMVFRLKLVAIAPPGAQ